MTHVDRFRAALVDACRNISDESVLLLSGGLDSGSILAACVEAGVQPYIVTASFGEFPNEDNRLAIARARAIAPGFRIFHLPIPRDDDAAVRHIKQAIRIVGHPRKTAIEVGQMVFPLVDWLSQSGCTAVVNGMVGGVLWGATKEAVMAYHKGGYEAWQAARLDDYEWELKDEPTSATRMTRKVVQDAGMLFLDPLLATADLLLDCTYDQLNRPKIKQLALDAFPALKLTPTRTGGLQVVSGVREYMTLLAQERGYRSAVAWYNDIARNMGVPLRVQTK